MVCGAAAVRPQRQPTSEGERDVLVAQNGGGSLQHIEHPLALVDRHLGYVPSRLRFLASSIHLEGR
jgi:hypothetical protein